MGKGLSVYAFIATAAALGLTAATGTARAETVVEVHAVIHAGSGLLLGGSSGSGWLGPEMTAPTMRDGEIYRAYGLDGPTGEVKGGLAESAGDPCRDAFAVPLADGPGAMAFRGDWNAMPRTPEIHDPGQRVYRDAAAAWLEEQGMENPVVELEQIIRIDLEGDGVDEVLMSANYQIPRSDGDIAHALAGDYSFVLLRRLNGGKVETLNLASVVHVDPQSGSINYWHRIAAILDLNGDGVMEIVVENGYYEGEGVGVFDVQDGGPELVLGTGCGA